MPAPLRVVLTEAEDLTLEHLRQAATVPKRTRDRAHMIRLNSQGWTVREIGKIFLCHQHTVRTTLKRWQTFGISRYEGKQKGAEQSENGLRRTYHT